MSNNPLWLTLATAAAVGAAVWTGRAEKPQQPPAQAKPNEPGLFASPREWREHYRAQGASSAEARRLAKGKGFRVF
jgi:hypothetical protein